VDEFQQDQQEEMTKTVQEGMKDVLQSAGMDVHQVDPLEVIDKVGYLHRGYDAVDLLYEASEIYVNKTYVDPERQKRLDRLAEVRRLDLEARKSIKQLQEQDDQSTGAASP
jgi:hypothetical protein